MWTKLKEVFEDFDYPYARQGSYAVGAEIPESVFTFWNQSTPEGAFYDNEANKGIWTWYVYFYTRKPELLYSVMDEFIAKAKQLGFINDGRAEDIPADEPDYVGRFVRLKYVENYRRQ